MNLKKVRSFFFGPRTTVQITVGEIPDDEERQQTNKALEEINMRLLALQDKVNKTLPPEEDSNA
jgi:hypothetical protein